MAALMIEYGDRFFALNQHQTLVWYKFMIVNKCDENIFDSVSSSLKKTNSDGSSISYLAASFGTYKAYTHGNWLYIDKPTRKYVCRCKVILKTFSSNCHYEKFPYEPCDDHHLANIEKFMILYDLIWYNLNTGQSKAIYEFIKLNCNNGNGEIFKDRSNLMNKTYKNCTVGCYEAYAKEWDHEIILMVKKKEVAKVGGESVAKVGDESIDGEQENGHWVVSKNFSLWACPVPVTKQLVTNENALRMIVDLKNNYPLFVDLFKDITVYKWCHHPNITRYSLWCAVIYILGRALKKEDDFLNQMEQTEVVKNLNETIQQKIEIMQEKMKAKGVETKVTNVTHIIHPLFIDHHDVFNLSFINAMFPNEVFLGISEVSPPHHHIDIS